MNKINVFHRCENNLESEGLKNINEILKNNAVELNKMDIPVDEECRLQIDGFKNYSKEKQFYDKIREDRFKERFNYENRSQHLGEQFEKFKTAFLQKYLHEEFIICRTSFFDDVFNGVDNIILDRKEGNIVCAFDEVCDIHSQRYEEKREKIIEVNRIGGTKIDYGLKFNPQNNQIILNPLSNIPLFFLALNEKVLKENIKKFQKNQNSEFDWGILLYFIESLKQQSTLLINICAPNSEVSKRIEKFRNILFEISRRYNLSKNKK